MKKEAFIRIRPVSPQTASLKNNISACTGFLCLLIAFALAPCSAAQAQSDAFIIIVKTDNPGTSNNMSFTIPTTGGGYNYQVDWNDDGTYDQSGITGNVTHNFGAVGVYIIRIRGAFPRIYFNHLGDRQKLMGVWQWGSTAWTSMERAFYGCSNLHIGASDVPNLSNVTSMWLMFAGCSNLDSPSNIGSWNTANVTNMSEMFAGASAFNQSIGTWNTTNVTTMRQMFEDANDFNRPIGAWNTAKVTTMVGMFAYAKNFNQPIGNWNTGAVTSMRAMFTAAENFNQPIGNWNTANVTDMSFMFDVALDFNQPIGNWNTAKVTDMVGMFQVARSFNQPIGNWNTAKVTSMGNMFTSADAFNQPIGNWNTANVTDMSLMFYSANAFNQPIGTWNTAKVTSMVSMFQGADVFNQPIGDWDTGNVRGMNGMFSSALSFNQPIGNWNTARVKDMREMFFRTFAFNQPIGDWNTADVENMSSMFALNGVFNQPIGNWNTANVSSMDAMFLSATAFNQPIGNWTLHPDANISALLNNCGMDCNTYSSTLNGWANNPATPSGRSLGAAGRSYGTNANAGRTSLTSGKGWTINDDATAGTSCVSCPSLASAPPEATIVNSVCAANCSSNNGSIVHPAASPCPPGSSVQYQTDGGAWAYAPPAYNQNGPAQTIKTRCSCDGDNTVNGPASSGAATTPGTCSLPSFGSCPTNMTVVTAAGLCSRAATYAAAASGLPAPAMAYALTGATIGGSNGTGSGAVFNLGVTTVRLTATSSCGSSTCSFTVTVADNQPPVITCPAPLSRNTGAGQCSAVVTYAPTVSDNCSATVTVTSGLPSGATFPRGTTTIALKATDPAGLTDVCQFTVTVTDNQPPTITCPANIARNTDANQCSATVTYAPTVSDNCSATVSVTSGLPSGSAFPKGTTTVELKATDPADLTASCQFIVTVVDNQPPSIVCPANIVRSTDPNLCSAVVTYTTPSYSDNCAGGSAAILPGSLSSGSVFPKGVNLVSWQAADAAGLTAICQFSVTVNDTQLPSITCPANQSIGTTPTFCTGIATFATPSGSDNCALSANAVTQTGGPASGSAFPKGQTTVTFKVTDAAGLTKTCTFRVTVNDTENPLIACPSSQSANTGTGTCTALVTYPAPTATDNCGSLTVVRIGGPASGSQFPAGTTNVTWRAIDGAGRSSTCSFAVAVTDATPPTISCPNSVSVTGSGSPCTAMATYANPTATDNCGVQSVFLLSGLPSGSSFPAGTTNVVWRAVDGNGNSATCAFSVTVGCGASPSPSEGGEGATALLAPRSATTFSPPSEGLGEVAAASPLLRGGRVGLSLSPNPATTEVQIFSEKELETDGVLAIYDAQGRLMWQQTAAAGQQQWQLDLSRHWEGGVYFVTLQSGGQTTTKRLIVSKL
jgi:surface protein